MRPKKLHPGKLQSGLVVPAVLGVLAPLTWATASASATGASCPTETITGEVHHGQSFEQPIGNGLVFALDAVASGWIVRVRPADPAARAQAAGHDYAELATPPYRSVTPLSVSTDFAFRAQDAIAWNPRHFRFATSPQAYLRLHDAYQRLTEGGADPPATVQVELSHEIAGSAQGTLTIADAKLVAGTADQSSAAATVATHLGETAHTLLDLPAGKRTPLGLLDWMRFRVELTLPAGFPINRKLYPTMHLCQSR